MTDEHYYELFTLGYEAYFTGEDPPAGLTQAERSAWRDGWNTATEESQNDE